MTHYSELLFREGSRGKMQRYIWEFKHPLPPCFANYFVRYHFPSAFHHRRWTTQWGKQFQNASGVALLDLRKVWTGMEMRSKLLGMLMHTCAQVRATTTSLTDKKGGTSVHLWALRKCDTALLANSWENIWQKLPHIQMSFVANLLHINCNCNLLWKS